MQTTDPKSDAARPGIQSGDLLACAEWHERVAKILAADLVRANARGADGTAANLRREIAQHDTYASACRSAAQANTKLGDAPRSP